MHVYHYPLPSPLPKLNGDLVKSFRREVNPSCPERTEFIAEVGDHVWRRAVSLSYELLQSLSLKQALELLECGTVTFPARRDGLLVVLPRQQIAGLMVY